MTQGSVVSKAPDEVFRGMAGPCGLRRVTDGKAILSDQYPGGSFFPEVALPTSSVASHGEVVDHFVVLGGHG